MPKTNDTIEKPGVGKKESVKAKPTIIKLPSSFSVIKSASMDDLFKEIKKVEVDAAIEINADLTHKNLVLKTLIPLTVERAITQGFLKVRKEQITYHWNTDVSLGGEE